MAARGSEIHSLQQKLRVITETLCEIGKLRSPSIPDFAGSAGIDYDTLKTAWRSGRLSIELQRKIAKAANFEITDPAWVDHDVDVAHRSSPDSLSYPGRDSVSGFRVMLRRRLELAGAGTSVRIRNDRPRLVDNNLASFSIDDSGQGALLGEPNPLFLSLIIEPGFHPKGFTYGFQRVRVRLIFESTSQARLKERLSESKAVLLNGAKLEVRGSEHNPEWFLCVPDSILKGEYVTTEALCSVNGSYVGEQFRAEIAVRPMDGTVVGADGAPLLDSHKRHILELLCAKRLPGTADSQGWVSLGVQLLQVVRGDSA